MSAEMEAKAVEPKGSQIQKHGSKEEQDWYATDIDEDQQQSQKFTPKGETETTDEEECQNKRQKGIKRAPQ
jgi:hypothetical protein